MISCLNGIVRRLANSCRIIVPKALPPARRGPRLAAWLVVWLCCVPATLLALEAIPQAEEISVPADLGQVDFYLLTIDVGNHVWDNFGHTALRVVDRGNGTDTVFNWGLFDMSGGVVAFSFNFFKGIMDYRLGTSAPARELAMYRQEQRTVWQDRINLSNQQKAVLYRRLMWNLQADNLIYPYDYFFDNCTTRVRDYLDEAVEGRIRAATTGITANTFRDLVKYHYNSLPLIEISLDVLMNSNIDRSVSEWEEMFLPLSLRARLLGIPADVAVDGQRLALLSDTEVLMEFPRPQAQADPYYVATGGLLLPVLLLMLLMRRVSRPVYATRSRISLAMPGVTFRLLGLTGLLVCLFSGIYGILMLGGWFFSGHEDLYGNFNLLLFWPTDLLGVFPALRWLLWARPWPLTHNSAPFFNYYMLLRLASMLAFAIMAGLGLAAQSLLPLLLYVAPGLFLFALLVWIVGMEPARSRDMLL